MSVDVRQINVMYFSDISVENDEDYLSKKQKISAKYEGTEIGFINFFYVEQYDYDKEANDTVIYLALIEVNPEYRGLGISGLLYKKFGEVYSQRYMGLPVERHFENPLAEYSFKKAIDQGWVPTEAYTPDRTTRDYGSEEKTTLWNDLKQKLPENLQASRVSRLLKVALTEQEKIDLRENIEISEPEVQMKNDKEPNFKYYAYQIQARHNGNVVGKLDYNSTESDGTNELYIDFLFIEPEYRSAGVGQLLYKKFGEVYEQKYNGWELGRQFANPVAEYAFRKAVSLGWVPEASVTEHKIERMYNDDDKKLYNDLRKKLPEQYRGPEASVVKNTTSRLKKTALNDQEKIDLRKGIQFEITGPGPDKDWGELNRKNYIIKATYNSDDVGHLDFAHYVPKDEFKDDQNIYEYLYISFVYVSSKYENAGVGQLLFKEFGKLYQEKFNGLPVGRHYINPVAEYAFRKAVSLGWLPEITLSEDETSRDYETEEKKKLWNDLRQKLPEQYRGPEANITKKDLRKLAVDSSMTDVRSGIQLEDGGSIGSSDYGNGVATDTHMIFAYLNNQEVGSIRFTVFKCDPNGAYAGRDKIHIDLIKVNEQNQNLGIGQLLLQKFGEVYQQQFDRMPVSVDFHNPIAEYSYRKAVSLGWISGWALDDDKLKRNYNKNDKTLWKDLRKKIPPMYRGSSRLKRVAASPFSSDDEKLDFRNNVVIEETENEDMTTSRSTHYITFRTLEATWNGETVGDMQFTACKPKEDRNSTEGEYLYIESVHIEPKFQNCGIGQLMYKKFGEIYSNEYNGWPVGRFYVNPVAEYAFRKAVAVGWVPEITLVDESKVDRSYGKNVNTRNMKEDELNQYNNDRQLYLDLRQKLPEHVRGQEANLKKDMRKTANTVEVSPIDIQQRDLNSRARKIEIFRDGEMLGDMKYEVYPEQNYIYINYVDVQEQYRKNGVAMLLYKTFSEVYNSKYPNWKIGRVFINPVAEYTYAKAVAMGWFPESTLDNVKRDYNSGDEEKWYNELEPKLRDFRQKNKKVV